MVVVEVGRGTVVEVTAVGLVVDVAFDAATTEVVDIKSRATRAAVDATRRRRRAST
jgi:hypothetical protein